MNMKERLWASGAEGVRLLPVTITVSACLCHQWWWVTCFKQWVLIWLAQAWFFIFCCDTHNAAEEKKPRQFPTHRNCDRWRSDQRYFKDNKGFFFQLESATCFNHGIEGRNLQFSQPHTKAEKQKGKMQLDSVKKPVRLKCLKRDQSFDWRSWTIISSVWNSPCMDSHTLMFLKNIWVWVFLQPLTLSLVPLLFRCFTRGRKLMIPEAKFCRLAGRFGPDRPRRAGHFWFIEQLLAGLWLWYVLWVCSLGEGEKEE